MYSLILSYRFTQATMLRMCFWLVFAGFAATAHTAQSEEGAFSTDLEILTIQPVRSGIEGLLPYRLDVNFTLIRSKDSAPVGSSTPRLYLVAEPKKEAGWTTNSRWKVASESDHVLVSPILRFESKGERIEIKPQRHAVWIGWRKELP